MKSKAWSAAETAFIHANSGKLSHKEIARRLGRSRGAISQRMWKLKLKARKPFKYWTEEEANFLKTRFDPARRTPSAQMLARALDRSLSSVVYQLRNLNLWESAFKQRRWTKSDLRTLMIGCETLSTHALAKKLGRSYVSTKCKMLELGYKALCGVYSLNQVAAETGYDEKQLIRAKKMTRQTWHKARSNRYVIRADQVEALCDYLKNEGRPSAA